MNSHLGRFLMHADELLQECRGFGESLRTSLEGELEKMHDTVAHGLDAAAQRTAEHAAARLGSALDTALGDRLAVLRRELDELGRMTRQAQEAQARQAAGRADASAPLPGLPVTGTAVAPPASARTPWPRGLTVLLASANAMLAVLLVLAVVIALGGRDGAAAPGRDVAQTGAAAGIPDASPAGQTAPVASPPGTSAAPGAAQPGAPGTASNAASGTGADATSWPALCQPLSETADPAQAHAFVAAAAAAVCGDRAGAVTNNVLAGVRAVPQAPGTAAPDKPASEASDKPAGSKSGTRPPMRSRRDRASD